ncbi:MAG: cytochrome c biogenesis protein CcsA, partial [Propionibacteriaceae bacterium]|nr:cytochrome c biogenesis protein CcsA [Propionibacteriaceae bacterium]
MLELSRILMAAAMALLTLALIVNAVVVSSRGRRSAATTARAKVKIGTVTDEPTPVTPTAGHPISPLSPAEVTPETARPRRGVAWAADRGIELALLCLTAGLIARVVVTGHAPFSNQYEFACSFAWGITAAYIFFNRRYHLRAVSLAVLPFAVVMLLYAGTVGAEARPLMPALQNHWLLTLHVATAVIAYGAAAVAFGAAVLYLLSPRLKVRALPGRELLDEIGYRAVVVTFPMLTVMIILGSVWADIAWGRYWSWDPK